MGDTTDCRCCAGTTVETPAATNNLPGLPVITYRFGTQPTIRASLLARLSSADFPALASLDTPSDPAMPRLTTRNDDDWSIALCDAFACAADVFTFYQERIANERYLRTATERRSLYELARLVGYQPSPGVAAGTALAFTLETSPGQPALAAKPVTIPAGTRVQSVPDPGQTAQTFETVKDIQARVEWNAIPAQLATQPPVAAGATDVYVTGTTLQLQAGDVIAFIDGTYDQHASDGDDAPVRTLDEVEEDNVRKTTRLVWKTPLPTSICFEPQPQLFVFRDRTRLFGAGAPDARLMPRKTLNASLFDDIEWANFKTDAGGPVDLEAQFPKVTNGSWVALTEEVINEDVSKTIYTEATALVGSPSASIIPLHFPKTWRIGLYHVDHVVQTTRAAFTLSSKITRIYPVPLPTGTPTTIEAFSLRGTMAHIQSEALTLAPRPVFDAVAGSTLTLGVGNTGLLPGQKLALSGKLPRVALTYAVTPVTVPSLKGRAVILNESFRLTASPRLDIKGLIFRPFIFSMMTQAPQQKLVFQVLDHDGLAASVTAIPAAFKLLPPLPDDPVLTEVVTIDDAPDAITSDATHTVVKLKSPMVRCYDRLSFAVNANVADATHGETVSEISGGGNAAVTNQSFALRQSPQTYVSSSTAARGAQATLQVRVNNLLWTERPSLFKEAPTAHVYTLSQDHHGATTVQFGDGMEGARLPAGQNNVRMLYRKGLGTVGNLRAGQLTSLLTRPLGVKSVLNANAATGGQDAESLERARLSAPLPMLTLERAVSPMDYLNYARAFAGIAKAHALWLNTGVTRGVFLTVAGEDGGDIPVGSDTQVNLIASLRSHGDPLVPLVVQNYRRAAFGLTLTVHATPASDATVVQADVLTALLCAFGFDGRDFGQPVSLDEIYAVVQKVDDVVASDIAQLYRVGSTSLAPPANGRLFAALPIVAADGSVSAAELLTIDPAHVNITVTP